MTSGEHLHTRFTRMGLTQLREHFRPPFMGYDNCSSQKNTAVFHTQLTPLSVAKSSLFGICCLGLSFQAVAKHLRECRVSFGPLLNVPTVYGGVLFKCLISSIVSPGSGSESDIAGKGNLLKLSVQPLVSTISFPRMMTRCPSCPSLVAWYCQGRNPLLSFQRPFQWFTMHLDSVRLAIKESVGHFNTKKSFFLQGEALPFSFQWDSGNISYSSFSSNFHLVG